MPPLVISAADDESRLVPDDLATNGEADSKQRGFHLARVQAGVPHISDVTREQRPGLAPVRVIVIEDPHPLDDLTQLGTIGLDNEVDRQAVGGAISIAWHTRSVISAAIIVVPEPLNGS